MQDHEDHIDRRKTVVMREFFSPIITAIIVGIGSSFATTYLAINTLQLKVQYIEKNVDTLSQIVKDINKSELRINRIEMLIEAQEKFSIRVEERVSKIESGR